MSERAVRCCMHFLNASNFTRIYRARKSKLKLPRQDCYLSNFNFSRRTNIISRHSYHEEAIDLYKIAVHVAFNWTRSQSLRLASMRSRRVLCFSLRMFYSSMGKAFRFKLSSTAFDFKGIKT